MFSLYCNKCYQGHFIVRSLEFYLSRCSHILCRQCVAANCPVCNKPYKAHKISKNMPRAMMEFFEDPMKIFRRYQKVAQFQLAQQDRSFLYWQEQQFKQFSDLGKRKNAMNKLFAELDSKTEKEKQRVEKMKAYLAFHKRRNEQPGKLHAPVPRRGYTSNADVLLECSQRFIPPTPTLSTVRSNNDGSKDYHNFKEYFQL